MKNHSTTQALKYQAQLWVSSSCVHTLLFRFSSVQFRLIHNLMGALSFRKMRKMLFLALRSIGNSWWSRGDADRLIEGVYVCSNATIHRNSLGTSTHTDCSTANCCGKRQTTKIERIAEWSTAHGYTMSVSFHSIFWIFYEFIFFGESFSWCIIWMDSRKKESHYEWVILNWIIVISQSKAVVPTIRRNEHAPTSFD